MSEEVKNFIDKMAQNDMVGAGDAFKDALRAKVGDQLDVKRQDVAGNMRLDIVEKISECKIFER